MQQISFDGALGLANASAVTGQENVVAPVEQDFEGRDVVRHAAFRRRNDRRVPRHDMIAGEDERVAVERGEHQVLEGDVADDVLGVALVHREPREAAVLEHRAQGGEVGVAVDVDIVPSQIGEACHVWLPAATAGEMNLTSMNGERRMRLTERYMDPPGQALPDCLIAARIANHMEAAIRAMGDAAYADQFKGFDWQTEEDAFMDGYHAHEKGGEFVTYERLRAMGTNGFQEPATAFENGKIVGTKRLYADGKFGKTGTAKFMATQWRGLEAPGKQEQKDKFAYLINNGRANAVWQNAYLDQKNEFLMDRWPYPYIQLHPDDMAELGVGAGDLVEVYNDAGSTQAMVQPTPTAKRKESFMLFAYPSGVQGNVVNAGVNEFIIPNYKQTWGNIRKIADAPGAVKGLTFKSWEYQAT